MNTIAFIDTEVRSKGKILDIGSVRIMILFSQVLQ